MTTDQVLATIERYKGQKEKPNNSGFEEKWLEDEMKLFGWAKGKSWCMYQAKIIFYHLYSEREELAEQIMQFSGLALNVKNKVMRGDFDQLKFTREPEPGAITIFSHYYSGEESWQGHAGIFIQKMTSGIFEDFEGNTNKKGSSNGEYAMIKNRSLNFEAPEYGTGLRLKGFIIPK